MLQLSPVLIILTLPPSCLWVHLFKTTCRSARTEGSIIPVDWNVVGSTDVGLLPSFPRAAYKIWAPWRFTGDIFRFIWRDFHGRGWKTKQKNNEKKSMVIFCKLATLKHWNYVHVAMYIVFFAHYYSLTKYVLLLLSWSQLLSKLKTGHFK